VDGDLDDRLEAAASDPGLLVELGCDLADAGRPVDAERCFRRAVQLGETWAALNLGNALAAQRRWADAVPAYEQAIATGETDAWVNLGVVREELGDVTGAMRAYREAARTGDSNGALALAFLLKERGEPEEADQMARQALDAGNRAAAGVLASWAWNRTLDPTLEPALRAGAERYPAARADLAELLRSTGRAVEARSVLERGAKLGERELWLPLGNLYGDELRDQAAAEQAYLSGIAAGDSYCHHNLGLLLAERGDVDGAEEQFRLGASAGDQKAAAALRRLMGEDG
jgi:tetratricopeptide (TPR) repeat protein